MVETSRRHLLETLRRLPLFTDLTESELALIAAQITVQHFRPRSTIFSEGDPCSELLIVRDGRVNLLKTSAHGRQQLLSVERAGSSLSEISALDGSPYPVTAESVTDTTLLRLEAGHFRAICLQHPELALKVIKVLGHRLRRMSSLIEDLSFSTVRGRLVAHLVHLAREDGHRTSLGIEFDLLENNEQLAARLGTVRELVSRNLGRLHNEGLIEMSRRKVRIPNLNALTDELVRNR
ncbi:MAG TPA: Crp/Fnr family transcriptional regulator [Candidatus Angelobacter sp.]|jgi:CRP/FNR family transcriptional regulator|nr:Crp/Fnr family transcriptional regulator [Candidatus Angelobacter sp.]